MSPFPPISYDILRLLLEFPASCDRSIASNLSLVSKETQLWADPHLFRFLVRGTQYDDSKIILLADDMCSDRASPRLVRARSYVHVLVFAVSEAGSMYDNLTRYFTLFPNLVNLCVWDNYLPELFELHIALRDVDPPRLRRIHTCSSSLESLPPQGFDYPLWRHITYLHLNIDYAICTEASPFSRPLFKTMRSLTHLAIGPGSFADMEVETERGIALTISRATASFPATLELCLLSFPPELISDHPSLRIDSIRLGEVPEIVLWSMPYHKAEFILDVDSHGSDTLSVWSGAPVGKMTFWEAGSEIQRRRKLVGQPSP
ncbi:hypothetical protein DL96DRAFT_1678099 [Flagelloscypha sp. PMI_526]|nr:hypothetical protein DL96DRAFT_1678099 [Flagelloscypha sp. PMI_526]